jgi:hypothetical protein
MSDLLRNPTFAPGKRALLSIEYDAGWKPEQMWTI